MRNVIICLVCHHNILHTLPVRSHCLAELTMQLLVSFVLGTAIVTRQLEKPIWSGLEGNANPCGSLLLWASCEVSCLANTMTPPWSWTAKKVLHTPPQQAACKSCIGQSQVTLVSFLLQNISHTLRELVDWWAHLVEKQLLARHETLCPLLSLLLLRKKALSAQKPWTYDSQLTVSQHFFSLYMSTWKHPWAKGGCAGSAQNWRALPR